MEAVKQYNNATITFGMVNLEHTSQSDDGMMTQGDTSKSTFGMVNLERASLSDGMVRQGGASRTKPA